MDSASRKGGLARMKVHMRECRAIKEGTNSFFGGGVMWQ